VAEGLALVGELIDRKPRQKKLIRARLDLVTALATEEVSKMGAAVARAEVKAAVAAAMTSAAMAKEQRLEFELQARSTCISVLPWGLRWDRSSGLAE
jgi:hypothetical protein